MRAIDLYAGIGGWALGLKMAGVEVVSSYEWWGPAAATHRANLPGEVFEVDIRTMDLDSLPSDIDIVVGSPPCTQFSYANRGGSGDLSDGIKDLYRFFEIVKHIRPKHWAMENVPRVAQVIRQECEDGGALYNFRDIISAGFVEIVDMSDFGLPQRRKRCIAGNFDPSKLQTWSEKSSSISLGQVIEKLDNNTDPIYRDHRTNRLCETENERPLNKEEARFNKEMKTSHPVYNGMAFPDPLDRPSRTVTATCTRVSRESLIIEETDGRFRRLNVRERASLQGFPVKYQFHGKSHSEKLKMIGNAIPPVIAYYIARSFKSDEQVFDFIANQIDANNFVQFSSSPITSPDAGSPNYRADRRFRFAVPNLRFKSGMRFDFTNEADELPWRMDFFFGDSKHIERRTFFELSLPSQVHGNAFVTEAASRVRKLASETCMETMQLVWAHQIDARAPHPFDFVDELGSIAADLAMQIKTKLDGDGINSIIASLLQKNGKKIIGQRKINIHAASILAGIIISSALNKEIKRKYVLKAA